MFFHTPSACFANRLIFSSAMKKTNGRQLQNQLRSRNRNFDFCKSSSGQRLLHNARWLAALRKEILSVANDAGRVRLRQVMETPFALYRLELENPALRYQRTALLDNHNLRMLLEEKAVRAVVRIRKGRTRNRNPDPQQGNQQ